MEEVTGMTPKEVVELAKKNAVRIVDIKFTDLLGAWQHFSVPTSELEGRFQRLSIHRSTTMVQKPSAGL